MYTLRIKKPLIQLPSLFAERQAKRKPARSYCFYKVHSDDLIEYRTAVSQLNDKRNS